MSEKINSSKLIATAHANGMKNANASFSDAGNVPEYSEQQNSPTEAMRATFWDAQVACTNLGGCLKRDADRISQIAEALEKLDLQIKAAYE